MRHDMMARQKGCSAGDERQCGGTVIGVVNNEATIHINKSDSYVDATLPVDAWMPFPWCVPYIQPTGGPSARRPRYDVAGVQGD